jgi:hypothetical protein
MTKYDKILRDIRLLKKDLRSIDKNLPYLTGLYGEILVLKELKRHFEKQGFNVGFGSGQTKADFILRDKIGERSPIRIEVKSSTLKNEGFGDLYGFAINPKECKNHKNKKDFCYFDYLITVPLQKNSKKQKFYIFSKDFIEKKKKNLINRHRRFGSIAYRIILLPKNYNYNRSNTIISQFDIRLSRNKKKYENVWSSLIKTK